MIAAFSIGGYQQYDFVSQSKRSTGTKCAYVELLQGNESPEDPRVVEAVEYFQAHPSKELERALKKFFQDSEADKVNGILEAIAYKGLINNNFELHKQCLALVTSEKLNEILRTKSDELDDMHKLVDLLAKTLPKKPGSTLKKSFILKLKRFFAFILNFIPNLINTFLIAFSLNDIGKEPQSAWEASAMLEIYWKFFMIPATIVIVLNFVLPPLGASIYAIATVIVLILLAALIIYVKWLRPCPSNLPHSHNLTEQAKLGYLSPVIGREDEIQRLISIFTDMNDNTVRHALFVGPSGVGKTEIVKGLAQRIALGDVPKSLKNKKVFVVNTAGLVQGGMYGFADQMNFLVNRIKGYEKEVILFFDEIHVALKNNSCLSDFLKPLLDRGRIHCIAATTTEEFNRYIRGSAQYPGDPAFARRFEIIEVNDMSKDDTKRVLQGVVQDSSRGIMVENAVLDYVIERTNEISKSMFEERFKRHQPALAVEVLTQAINQVSASYQAPFLPVDYSEKVSKLASLKQSLTNGSTTLRPYTDEGREVFKEIARLEGEIAEENKRIQDKRSKLQLFKKYHEFIKKKNIELGDEARKVMSAERNREFSIKQYFWEYQYLLPQIERVLEELKDEVSDDNFKVAVDTSLIDEIIGKMNHNLLAKDDEAAGEKVGEEDIYTKLAKALRSLVETQVETT